MISINVLLYEEFLLCNTKYLQEIKKINENGRIFIFYYLVFFLSLFSCFTASEKIIKKLF